MKISNSKKQLAKIISENGGWPVGAESAAQCIKGEISFWHDTATKRCGEDWCGSYLGSEHDIKFTGGKLPNWHQTILSRDEYFHLYPAQDADVPSGDGVTDDTAALQRILDCSRRAATIEQLAAEYRNRQDYAERKQQEADAAKAEAEAKLSELVAAGKAIGLALSVAAPEPELVITDWRDLRVGDEVEANYRGIERVVGSVLKIDIGDKNQPVFVSDGKKSIWATEWKFIRRPSKEAAHA